VRDVYISNIEKIIATYSVQYGFVFSKDIESGLSGELKGHVEYL